MLSQKSIGERDDYRESIQVQYRDRGQRGSLSKSGIRLSGGTFREKWC